MGRRGAENTGSELLKRKQHYSKIHAHVKNELETIQSKVETLERLATDSAE